MILGRNKDHGELLRTLGHEGFHRAVAIIYGNKTVGTQQEEAIARGLGLATGSRLGYTTIDDVGKDLNPRADFETFKGTVNTIGSDLFGRGYRNPSADEGSNISLSSLYGLVRAFWPGAQW